VADSSAGADTLAGAFDLYRERFAAITARSRRRFAARDWTGARTDAAERLALYKTVLDEALTRLTTALGAAARERTLWVAMRERYAAAMAGRDDRELAATFFNSAARRVLTIVGVDPEVEIKPVRARVPPAVEPLPVEGGGEALARRLLERFTWGAPYEDAARDARRIGPVLDAEDREAGGAPPDAVDVLPVAFFRNKGAYVVARVRRGDAWSPLVVAFLHAPRGVHADAVLTTSDEASIVFGFSWSYFHVDAPCPSSVVEFLATIMPVKRIDELYTTIGFNKHGKTELYRAVKDALARPDGRFVPAEGAKGLVMTVFALPAVNVVFKVIRDTFGHGKKTTRREVMEKYHFVFIRDRVGRLADAQEFEHVNFPRACFPPALLAELVEAAPSIVRLHDDRVHIAHLYTERLLTPLNLHLQQAGPVAARDAILDYGRAIRDMAAADIFAGDMLLKNFGVSRHGRVIFYDYDELSTITDCHFRRMPDARSDTDELSAEPWYSVAEHDVFPEEFLPFLVPDGPLREAFLSAHGDLLDVRWWQRVQERLREGELFDFYPYRAGRRLGTTEY
jgi:isocitrate dehydrogenase kinase/phosphatase